MASARHILTTPSSDHNILPLGNIFGVSKDDLGDEVVDSEDGKVDLEVGPIHKDAIGDCSCNADSLECVHFRVFVYIKSNYYIFIFRANQIDISN